MATLKTIEAKIAKLQAQAKALAEANSNAVLERIRGLMDKHGVVVADIEAYASKRGGRNPAVGAAASLAKYRDPKSGATWTGHGRAPAWIANAKDRSKFLVAGAPQSVAAVKKEPRPGNYVRGPQPALYRDPETGATWSGRGRAPAWLAEAKDRNKFLIAGAEDSTAAPKAKVAAKKAEPAKKTAAAKKTEAAK
jgi:DNA-binding protein H-NS